MYRKGLLIFIWEKVSLILSTWDCTYFPFNRLGKGGGGLATLHEGIGESLGEVELLIDSLSLGSSTSLDRIGIIREAHMSSPSREGQEDDGKGDLFPPYSRTWVSTCLPNCKEITTFTFRTSLGSKEEEELPLGFASG